MILHLKLNLQANSFNVIQEQKSALNICPEVAKHERADACRYGDKCRFSHDLDAFLAQVWSLIFFLSSVR